MVAANGTTRIHDALDRFQEAREGARRFHTEKIGREVNPYRCFADFVTCVRRNDQAALAKRYYAKVGKAAMTEDTGVSGGYLVPMDLAVGLLRDISTGSLWRRFGAFVQPMKTLQCHLPMPDVSTPQSAGTAPYYGGFLMQWFTQDQTVPNTAGMNFRECVLTANVLGGYVYASNPFLEDAVGVEEWLTTLFARGAAWYQDLAFFRGTGVGQPTGVANCAAAVQVTRSGGAGGKTLALADIEAMMSALLPSAWEEGAVWFCNPSVLPKMIALTSNWFINGPLLLGGLPVVPTGKCNTLGGIGDLILAAPSLYVIGDRMTVEVALAPEEPTGFKNNQSAFRVISRVDGQPATAAPITLPDGASPANLVSPFVVLV